jgi:hypothetical protein
MGLKVGARQGATAVFVVNVQISGAQVAAGIFAKTLVIGISIGDVLPS